MMENQYDGIDKTVIKLQVLESRIQQLQTIADEVLSEVNDKYKKEIDALYLKKEDAEQTLKKIRNKNNTD